MKGKLIICCVLLAMLNSCRQEGYVQITGFAQGGTWSVKYNSAGMAEAAKGMSRAATRRKAMKPADVQKAVQAILDDIDTTLSGYNKRSQLSRLNAGDTIVPTRMLIDMYDYSHDLWQETEGAVDCAAGPLFDIWGFGFKNDSLPSPGQVREAMAVSGMGRLTPRMEDKIMSDGRMAGTRLLSTQSDFRFLGEKPGMVSSHYGGGREWSYPQLNFNAVAQGYSCDTVARYLSSLGVKDMLVDIGEIYCRGVNQSGKPWKVGVDKPKDGNNIPGADLEGIWQSTPANDGQGIVTSGNYRKFYIRDGKKFTHTIDPRTGYPVGMGPDSRGSIVPLGTSAETLLSATIVAPTAQAADAYATYCMVIGLSDARAFVESRPDLEGYLIYSRPDGTMAEWRSPGFQLAQ